MLGIVLSHSHHQTFQVAKNRGFEQGLVFWKNVAFSMHVIFRNLMFDVSFLNSLGEEKFTFFFFLSEDSMFNLHHFKWIVESGKSSRFQFWTPTHRHGNFSISKGKDLLSQGWHGDWGIKKDPDRWLIYVWVHTLPKTTSKSSWK